MAGMPVNSPVSINQPKSLAIPELPAAANGPGVGGTSTCVVYKPVASAMLIAAYEVLVCFDKDRARFDRITKPESQKTGMPVIAPSVLMLATALFSPINCIMAFAMA